MDLNDTFKNSVLCIAVSILTGSRTIKQETFQMFMISFTFPPLTNSLTIKTSITKEGDRLKLRTLR